MPQPHVTTDPRLLPPNAAGWITHPDMLYRGRPTWSSHNVAVTFFGVSRAALIEWLYKGKTNGVFPERRTNGHYLWTLHSVERVAYALIDSETIKPNKLRLCLLMLQTVAEQNGLL